MTRQPTGPQDRARLDPETVAEHALELADSEGLDAVTVRRVARDLGVTPMALYWHFRAKKDLLTAVADRVLGEVDLAVDRTAPWLERFEMLLRSFVHVLRAHPSAPTLLSTGGMMPENWLRAQETALEVLRQGGFSPADATHVSRHAMRTAIDLVGGETELASSADEATEARRRTRVQLESLPLDRYPRIVEAAVPLSSCDDPEAYYAFGLRLLLAGVEAMAPRTP